MTVQITSECAKCGVCATVCPVGAIVESHCNFEVSENICTGCGACVNACPSEAIVQTASQNTASDDKGRIYKNCIGHGGRYKKGSYLSRMTNRLHL